MVIVGTSSKWRLTCLATCFTCLTACLTCLITCLPHYVPHLPRLPHFTACLTCLAKQLREAHFCPMREFDPCSCLARLCAVNVCQAAARSKSVPNVGRQPAGGRGLGLRKCTPFSSESASAPEMHYFHRARRAPAFRRRSSEFLYFPECIIS